MNFESLILDIDGTLWDSRQVVAESYNAQVSEEGYGRYCVDAETLTGVFGKTTKAIAEALFPDLADEIRYPLMDRCLKREDETLKDYTKDISYPGVKETLEKLAKKYRLFIVSNSECGYLALCMEKMGLENLISGHLCYGDTRTCKGETIKRLMADHQITSACYVGDTEGDMEASELAGIPFIYCSYGFGNPPRYWKKIDSFDQLLNL